METREERKRKLGARSRFRIGDLQIQPDRLIVVRDNKKIVLEPRMMEVLVLLAEHAGDTLSTDRMLVEAWGGAFFGDNPVQKTIHHLRDALGDDPRAPRYIETIRKRGYRLIAQVSLPEDYRRNPVQSDEWTAGSPYVGLAAFDAAHAMVFCGRNRMTAELLSAMRAQIENGRRFVLLLGPSGCGKTSLLRAGAVPLIVRTGGFDGLHAVSVASCDFAAARAHDIVTPLAAALATWTLGGRPVFPQQPVDTLAATLHQSPESIAQVVAEAFRWHAAQGVTEQSLAGQPWAHLLMIIDHAEILVSAADIDAGSLQALTRVLRALCGCPHVLTVMIARSDFYPKLIGHLPVLAECKAGDGHLDVLVPWPGEIAEIIRKPAWKANLSFETDPDNSTRLDDALRDAAISQPDAMPLLQHTLQGLYERRADGDLLTFKAYREMGGLEGAIAHRADQVFAALPRDARDALDVVMGHLVNVELEGGMVNARRVPGDVLPAPALVLAKAFISARLFVGDLDAGRPGFRVTHEALLRRWPIAADWILKNQRLLQAKESLRLATKRWDRDGRHRDLLISQPTVLVEAIEAAEKFADSLKDSEKEYVRQSKKSLSRRRRLLQASVTTLATLSVLSIALLIKAELSRKDAEQSRVQAQSYADYILEDLTTSLRSRGDLNLQQETNEKILAYFKDKPEDTLTDDEKSTLALALSMKGENAAVTSDWATVIQSFKKSEAIIDGMKNMPRKKRTLLANSINSQNLSSYYYLHENEDKKRFYLSKWVESSEALYHIDSRYTYLDNFANALDRLASEYLSQDRPEEAWAIIRRSRKIRSEAFDKTKVDGPAILQVANTQQIIAQIAEHRGNLEKSRSIILNSISNMKNKVKHQNEGRTLAWNVLLSIWLQNLSSINLATGRTTESIDNLQESIKILEKESQLNTSGKFLLNHISTAYLKLGQAQAALGQHKKSEKSIRTALDNFLPSDIFYAPFKETMLVLSQPPDAKEARTSMEALIERLRRRPDDIYSAMATADTLLEYGKRHRRMGNLQEAKTIFTRVKAMLSPWAATTKNHRAISLWIEASILNNETFPKAHVQRLTAIRYRSGKLDYLLELVPEADRADLLPITSRPQG
jgi:eukaryotic-like serine/threonine-protein kinase